MPKNLLLTEVLYAGGAVQEYVAIQPQTLTGWSGTDAGVPPVPPYCPPDPNTNQGPPPQEPPCVDVAGECIPIGKSEYIAVCGYKYIDLETGQIIGLSSDTQYPLVDSNSHQWLKVEKIANPEVEVFATGDTEVVFGAPLIKGTERTLTIVNNQYTDGYDKQDEVIELGRNYLHRYWPSIFSEGLIYYDSNGVEGEAWYDYRYCGPHTPSEDNRQHPLYQKLAGQNFNVFSRSDGGVTPDQSYKTWSDFKKPVPFAWNPFGYFGGLHDDDCVTWEQFHLTSKNNSGDQSVAVSSVNLVGTHQPLGFGWKNRTYPDPDSRSFNWSFYGRSADHFRKCTAVDAKGWGCKGEGSLYCADGQPFGSQWPCNCPGFGDPDSPRSASNCEWSWWDCNWDDSKPDGYFSDTTVADVVAQYIDDDTLVWGGQGYAGTGFQFIRLDCEWRIIEIVSTRNLPSTADIEGTVQYTYDADNKTYTWIWSNAHGWQSYGEKDYNGGDI